MKKYFLAFLILVSFTGIPGNCSAQPETAAQHDARMKWWREARFGMFIHWGLYAVPAGEWNGKTGYGEWIRNSAEIPLETYNQFAGRFNPAEFNADEWVKTAREAGMKYIVITSKHHDGFCMFGTKQTDFSILSTSFGKDPMKELSIACEKYGLAFCFYYSIMDWHHPDYLPRRSWEMDRSADGADFSKYVGYMKAELKELLTNYGRIGVLWFDGEWENTWNEKYGKEIYRYCRSLQPDIIINNRVGAGRMDMEGLTKQGMFGGDFGTPEQQIPPTGLPGVDWETCMTMNDHWGYNKNDKNFKSAGDLVRMLSDIASKGGNYLLNVGPTASGVFPEESVERLKEIGRWMSLNGEAIYETQASPVGAVDWGRCTMRSINGGTRLYLHVFKRPANGKLVVNGCLNKPVRAYLLSDLKGPACKTTRMEDAIVVSLPQTLLDTIVSVVVLDLNGKLDMNSPPAILTSFDTMVDTLNVRLETGRGNVQILYTLDGTDPKPGSSLYNKPFIISEPVAIAARCYRNGKPVSGISHKNIVKVVPWPAYSSRPAVLPGIRFSYYEGTYDSLPDFSKLAPAKTGVLQELVLPAEARKEFFAVRYEGLIQVPSTGMYAFSVSSDDGSKVVIDDKTVADNDGLHGMKEVEGNVPLAIGYHKFRVEFFQKTGSAGLGVQIRGTGLNSQPVPGNMLFNK